LALVVALIVFVVVRFGSKWRYLLSTFLLLFAIFYSAYHLSPVFRSRALMAVEDIRRIVVHSDFENSWGERIAMAIVASHEIADNPLVGVGVGDIMDEYRKELSKKELRKYDYTYDVPHVHNQFLQICAQTGLTGLALFVLFLVSLMKEAKRASSSLYRAALYSNMAIFIFGFFSNVLIRNYTSGLFAFILAYLLAGCKEESEG
jgi:O-antigen ligase